MDVENRPTTGPDSARFGPTTTTPATVTGDTPAAETSVIAEQQWQAIRERSAAGMSVSKIARELDLDRKRVRKALKGESWQPYRREALDIMARHEEAGIQG